MPFLQDLRRCGGKFAAAGQPDDRLAACRSERVGKALRDGGIVATRRRVEKDRNWARRSG
jgi:hypothetical protein